MYKLSGENGDGLASLGVRSFADGTYGIKAVSTQIVNEPPFNRKAGMGGPRYLRHCLESAILNRGRHLHATASKRPVCGRQLGNAKATSKKD